MKQLIDSHRPVKVLEAVVTEIVEGQLLVSRFATDLERGLRHQHLSMPVGEPLAMEDFDERTHRG